MLPLSASERHLADATLSARWRHFSAAPRVSAKSIYFQRLTLFSPLFVSFKIFKGQRDLQTLDLRRGSILVPEVDLNSPDPLLNGLTEESEAPVSCSTEPDLRFRLGISGEDEKAGVGNVGGPEYMQGSQLEEAGISESGYEQRPQVKVELAPGEQAEGYRH